MNDRPYRSFGIEELEAIVTKNWNDAAALQKVASELNNRHKARALRLLRKVEQRVAELSEQGEESGASQAAPSEHEVLYASVGLHPSAPDFLIKAARKAYRMQYHPDKYSGDEKSEAERAFKDLDNVFDKIERLKQ